MRHKSFFRFLDFQSDNPKSKTCTELTPIALELDEAGRSADSVRHRIVGSQMLRLACGTSMSAANCSNLRNRLLAIRSTDRKSS